MKRPYLLILGIPSIALLFLTATTVTLAAWLTDAIFCAIGFWRDSWEIGAYLAAFTIVVYTVEIVLSMREKLGTAYVFPGFLALVARP